ncbi:Histidine kinase-like ATPase domain-containing protein [Glycomyces sambucus]|uniref:Histidine kinase-like ATPase domain-containing protein n=1 Tax=Glycomyces sambucus TaxID=380244 RepID=A0A1G9GQT9_9ACTN|nr:ATP-binding protein [Glycomyces sambucus]SDL02962.1 Histidine kinase-like ATPase domain-containing protein [Glycomyces sambucus]
MNGSRHDRSGGRRPEPATVRFAFTPAAAYVRAARLVAADVAAHAGVATGLLDEVRQAVGEACTRAVLRHRDRGLRDLVRVEFSIGDRFVAKITDNAQDLRARSGDRVGAGTVGGDARANDHDALEEDTLSEEITLIVLGGLVEDLVVTGPSADGGTTVSMSWPLPGSGSQADH